MAMLAKLAARCCRLQPVFDKALVTLSSCHLQTQRCSHTWLPHIPVSGHASFSEHYKLHFIGAGAFTLMLAGGESSNVDCMVSDNRESDDEVDSDIQPDALTPKLLSSSGDSVNDLHRRLRVERVKYKFTWLPKMIDVLVHLFSATRIQAPPDLEFSEIQWAMPLPPYVNNLWWPFRVLAVQI
eukprot:12399318-Karenia_brevis.AAC.1